MVAGLEGARSIGEQELAQRLRSCGVNVRAAVADVAAACKVADEIATPADRVVVFGSFLTVGPAMEWLQQIVRDGGARRRND